MSDCDHKGSKRYARREFSNGSVHVCVQCIKCYRVVKLPEHNNRPFIRIDEVPAGRSVHEWIDPDGLV